jgi:bacteriocin-like protein
MTEERELTTEELNVISGGSWSLDFGIAVIRCIQEGGGWPLVGVTDAGTYAGNYQAVCCSTGNTM